MAKNQDSLIRQWHMLRMVPRYPHKIAVRDIQYKLELAGLNVTVRTVQRDLIELSEVFPLTVDDREKPFGWSWQKDAKVFDLPGLSVAEAVTLVMAEQHLTQLMPSSLLDQLAPHFRAAHDRLANEHQPHLGRKWLDKIRTVQPTQPLMPPTIDPEVQKVVSEAVLQERQIEIRYRNKGRTEAGLLTVHPLALVQRGNTLYLYGRLFDYSNSVILAVHRIESASMLEDFVVPPNDFDLDDRVAKGVWSFGNGEQIELKCRFFDGKGEHLKETPLSDDQQVEQVPDDHNSIIVTATVLDNPQLRWWILGFGDGVEVLEPNTLRLEFVRTASSLQHLYAAFGDSDVSR
mgnify:CR=1 FL=1